MEALPAPSRDSEAQLLAMLSKLWLIRRRDRAAALQIFGLPAFALSLCALVYEVFGRGLRHSTGYLELVVVPLFGVSAFGSSLATTLVAERSQGLLETMKIMSLKTEVYFGAYAAEGAATGFALSLGLAVLALGPFEVVVLVDTVSPSRTVPALRTQFDACSSRKSRRLRLEDARRLGLARRLAELEPLLLL